MKTEKESIKDVKREKKKRIRQEGRQGDSHGGSEEGRMKKS